MITIIRTPRKDRFDVVPQATVRDARLSFRALGVLIRLLSNADGFNMTSDHLAREESDGVNGREGREAIRKCQRELKKFGYMKTVVEKDQKGRWVSHVYIYDSPQCIPDSNLSPDYKEVTMPETSFRASEGWASREKPERKKPHSPPPGGGEILSPTKTFPTASEMGLQGGGVLSDSGLLIENQRDKVAEARLVGQFGLELVRDVAGTMPVPYPSMVEKQLRKRLLTGGQA